MKLKLLILAVALIQGAASAAEPAADRSITALDYTVPVKSLIGFFAERRVQTAETVARWSTSVSDELRNISRAKSIISEIEEELTERMNSSYKKYTTDILDMAVTLDTERAKAKSLGIDMAAGQAKITAELREMEKQELKLMNDKFRSVLREIKPTTPYPSQSTVSAQAEFSERPAAENLPGYLLPLNELLVWYWNVETSFAEAIESHNERIAAKIGQDSGLQLRQAVLEQKLSEYADKDAKLYKKETGELKKQISNLEKERKALAKSMSAESKELVGALKNLNAELQAAYKERISHIIDEMNYFYQEKMVY